MNTLGHDAVPSFDPLGFGGASVGREVVHWCIYVMASGKKRQMFGKQLNLK